MRAYRPGPPSPPGAGAAAEAVLECTVRLEPDAWRGAERGPLRLDLRLAQPAEGPPLSGGTAAIPGPRGGRATAAPRRIAPPGRAVSERVRRCATAAAIVYRRSGAVVAGYPQADLEAAGETRDSAFAALVALMLETYYALATAAPETLDAEARGRLAALRRIVDPAG